MGAKLTSLVKINNLIKRILNFKDDEVIFTETGNEIRGNLSTAIKEDIAKGETAYGWGNHADEDYLKTVTTGDGLTGNGTSIDPLQPLGGITFGADNAEEVIETGELPFGDYAVKSGTITKAYVKCYVSSTVTVDIYVNGSKISATAPLTITAGTELIETTFTGWTKTISAGDYITANVTANDNATKLLVKLITE